MNNQLVTLDVSLPEKIITKNIQNLSVDLPFVNVDNPTNFDLIIYPEGQPIYQQTIRAFSKLSFRKSTNWTGKFYTFEMKLTNINDIVPLENIDTIIQVYFDSISQNWAFDGLSLGVLASNSNLSVQNDNLIKGLLQIIQNQGISILQNGDILSQVMQGNNINMLSALTNQNQLFDLTELVAQTLEEIRENTLYNNIQTQAGYLVAYRVTIAGNGTQTINFIDDINTRYGLKGTSTPLFLKYLDNITFFVNCGGTSSVNLQTNAMNGVTYTSATFNSASPNYTTTGKTYVDTKVFSTSFDVSNVGNIATELFYLVNNGTGLVTDNITIDIKCIAYFNTLDNYPPVQTPVTY